jgi:hypothetical protein
MQRLEYQLQSDGKPALVRAIQMFGIFHWRECHITECDKVNHLVACNVVWRFNDMQVDVLMSFCIVSQRHQKWNLSDSSDRGVVCYHEEVLGYDPWNRNICSFHILIW